MSARRLAFHRPEQRWLLVWALLALALLLGGSVWLLRKHQWATQTLDAATPRIARLQGLQQSADALAQAETALQASLSQWAYAPAAGSVDDVGAEALQQVRHSANQRGLRVTSSQTALASEAPEGFERIQIEVRAEGDWQAVDAWLRDLADLRPAVYMGSASFIAMRTQLDAPPTLSVQASLFVLRQAT